jgi:phosphoribosylaminoimidazole-succinocarboxamide synthase
VSIQLYERAAAHALSRGIIIADTKFEFGLDAAGVLTLMDEVLTPDSSRFWAVESYERGQNPPSFDKQIIRDWLETVEVNGRAWDKKWPGPEVPKRIIQSLVRRYFLVTNNLCR